MNAREGTSKKEKKVNEMKGRTERKIERKKVGRLRGKERERLLVLEIGMGLPYLMNKGAMHAKGAQSNVECRLSKDIEIFY